MTVRQLINRLKKHDPKKEVFLRTPTPTGNIAELERVEDSTYGFFGKDIPCIILDWDRPTEKDIAKLQQGLDKLREELAKQSETK